MNRELEFSPERMRQIGYLVVDRMVEHLATLSSQGVGAKGQPAALIQALSEPAPEQATTPLAIQRLDGQLAETHRRFLSAVTIGHLVAEVKAEREELSYSI